MPWKNNVVQVIDGKTLPGVYTFDANASGLHVQINPRGLRIAWAILRGKYSLRVSAWNPAGDVVEVGRAADPEHALANVTLRQLISELRDRVTQLEARQAT